MVDARKSDGEGEYYSFANIIAFQGAWFVGIKLEYPGHACNKTIIAS